MFYISNAFSLSMLVNPAVLLTVNELTLDTAANLAVTATSVIGHDDTAALFSNLLNLPLATNRCSISLNAGDNLLVGQYTGPRLPEGTQVLPDGASIKWLMVSIIIIKRHTEVPYTFSFIIVC